MGRGPMPCASMKICCGKTFEGKLARRPRCRGRTAIQATAPPAHDQGGGNMRKFCAVTLLLLAATPVFGQLTMDQKITDFMNVAGVYDKNYGPYEWKRDAMGFDLLDIAPWLDKIRATEDDLDFYEVMVSYVASLNDAHDGYRLPSNFVARLNFGVDIYDGKLLVDTINRTRLPAAEFSFLIGYELASIDGKDAQEILDGLLQYQVAANPR